MPMYLPKTAASISDAADWLAIRDNQPISSSNEYQQPISSFRTDAKLTRSRKKKKKRIRTRPRTLAQERTADDAN